MRFDFTIRLKQNLTIENDIKKLESEFSAVRTDHVRHEGRIAVLEGFRDSMRKVVEIEIKNAINEMKIDWLSKQLEIAKSAQQPALSEKAV